MKLENRFYQPSLLWAYASGYMRKKEPDRDFRQGSIELLIYEKGKKGAFLMLGPKLYWTDSPENLNHFSNCEQDSLETNSGNLGEVVLHDRHRKETFILGVSFESAWKFLIKELGEIE